MRTIKFRSWDAEQNKMTSGATLRQVCLNAKGFDFYWDDELPIMQFTGLLDKNGKEIYEGDICRILYTDWPSNTDPHVSIDDYKKTISHYGQIIYEAPSFWIALKDRCGEMSFHSMMPGTHGEIEVIGNIYKNPELQ